MNLDTISKVCKMIDYTYGVIGSYFNIDGKLENSSVEKWKEEHFVCYLEQAGIIVQQCIKQRGVILNMDELALTWMGIPVVVGNIIRGCIIIGPFYSSRSLENILIESIGKMNISEEKKELILNYHNVISFYPYKDFVKLIKFVYFYLYEQEFDESKLDLFSQSALDYLEKEHISIDFNNNDTQIHGSYLYERSLLECVRTGNIVNLKQVLLNGFHGNVGSMVVGNELRQAKNEFIVSIALVTRAAIEGGLNSERAFFMSDIYIRQVETMKSVKDVKNHVVKMLFNYTEKVRELLKVNVYSYYVNQCCEYIQMNVYSSISVNQIADSLRVSQEHLTRQFKHETGMVIVEYIKKIKTKEAKYLLKYTDNSLVEISEKLAFSSQSYFNAVFKSEEGFTPKQYRDNVWSNQKNVSRKDFDIGRELTFGEKFFRKNEDSSSC